MYMFCVVMKTDEILSDVIHDIVVGPYEDVLKFRSVMGSYGRHVNVIHLPAHKLWLLFPSGYTKLTPSTVMCISLIKIFTQIGQ